MEGRDKDFSDQKEKLFKEFLDGEFERRRFSRPSYSLRTFARHLQINHGALSGFLSGKRKITTKTIERLGPLLGLSNIQVKEYVDIQNEYNQKFASFRFKRSSFESISIDQYHILSNWLHDAILELVEHAHFKPDIKWISNILGEGQTEVKMAIDRLFRHKMLEIGPLGNWINRAPNQEFLPEKDSQLALKNYQLGITQKSLDNLSGKDPGRIHSSLILPCSPKNFDKARELLREFRRKFCEVIQDDPHDTEIYALQIGLFPLTSINQGIPHENDQNDLPAPPLQ